MKTAKYSSIRDNMQPGDVIAFSGKGYFSEIVKFATKSPISHVGIVLKSKLMLGNSPQAGYFNQIIESTSLEGFSGVSITRISDRVNTYDGSIWWLPFSEESRRGLDLQKFYNFLLHQNGKQYDMPQAIKSALTLFENKEDFSKFFCSELAAAGLEFGGAIKNINASEVTPADLCSFGLYSKDYYQIKGDYMQINGFNSVWADDWGI